MIAGKKRVVNKPKRGRERQEKQIKGVRDRMWERTGNGVDSK
jgi:hypothetical protein